MNSFAFWEPILIYTMVNAIVTLGFYVTMSSGIMSVAHAAAAGMGAYAAAVLTTNFHWPFLPAILVGVCIGAVVGSSLALVTVRSNLLVSSLVTLGFGETMSVLAYNIEYLGGAKSFAGIPLYTNLPLAAAALLFVVYVVWRYDGSRLGLAARAVRDNPLAAAANGVNVVWIRVVTFGLGAAIAAFSGAISSHYTLVVNPADLGFFPSFYIQVYAIFGGSYSMWGGLLGAGILTILPQLLRFAATYRFALYGLLIVLVIILRPQGLLSRVPTGSKPRWLIRLRGKKEPSQEGMVAKRREEVVLGLGDRE